jgi:multiple antibiotic resistance protein
MPLMCGPGAIATILGMTSTIRQSPTELASFVAIVAAILATMLVTYLCLIYAGKLSDKLGAMGIDAITRIVGFFVSAIGVGLIFDGVIEALESHGSYDSALTSDPFPNVRYRPLADNSYSAVRGNNEKFDAVRQ